MRKHTDYVIDREGNAVAGAEVYVRLQSDNSLVDLFSDDGVTDLANPVTTDNDGEFSFYTADNTLKLQVFISGVQQQEVNHFQHYDELDNEIAAFRLLSAATDKLPYFDSSTTMALADFTSAGRALVDDASASAQRTTLGLVIGTNVAAFDATVQPAEWAPNVTDDADVYIPAIEAMTIDQGNAAIGTATITFAKSTTAVPGTFSSTTLPATLQAGAWLKVTFASVTGFCATHLVRTA